MRKSTPTSVGLGFVRLSVYLRNCLQVTFCITCFSNSLICPHTTEQNIASAHEKIAECKKEIQRAKRIRKNRQGKKAIQSAVLLTKDSRFVMYPFYKLYLQLLSILTCKF